MDEVNNGKKVRAIVEVRGYLRPMWPRPSKRRRARPRSSTRTTPTTSSSSPSTSTTLAAAIANDMVKAIYKDELEQSDLDVGARLIGSDRADEAGWTGKGSTIAVLDAGIDRDHRSSPGGSCVKPVSPPPIPIRSSRPTRCLPNGQPFQIGVGAADAKTARMRHKLHVVVPPARTSRASHPRRAGTAPSMALRLKTGVCRSRCLRLRRSHLGAVRLRTCSSSLASDQKVALQSVDHHAG